MVGWRGEVRDAEKIILSNINQKSDQTMGLGLEISLFFLWARASDGVRSCASGVTSGTSGVRS